MTTQSPKETYSVHFFCSCGDVHPMRMMVSGNYGAPASAINDVAQGVRLPAKTVAMINNTMRCPKTGALVTQKDNDDVFLVRIS